MRGIGRFDRADLKVVVASLDVVAGVGQLQAARFAGDGMRPGDGVPGDFVRVALGHEDGRGGLEGGSGRLKPAGSALGSTRTMRPSIGSASRSTVRPAPLSCGKATPMRRQTA